MSLVNAAPPPSGTPRNTRWLEVKLSSGLWPESRKKRNTSTKSAPWMALSMATMRRLMRFMRSMSIEPDMSSANVARPSCVAVVRGEPRAMDLKCGCSRPLSPVSECTKASCTSSWLRSYSEKPVFVRRRMRVELAAAFEIRFGSSSTRTLCWVKKASIAVCSSNCTVSAGST